MRELQLVQVINRQLNKNSILFKNEIRMAIGIPDVMYGFGFNELHHVITDYYLIKMYSLIKKYRIRSIKKLEAFTKSSKGSTIKILKKLQNANLVLIDNDNIEINRNLELSKNGTNISIEVKLSDWIMGLFQAKRYLLFSDYSYLAIHKKYLNNVDYDLFKSEGIGLIEVDEKNAIEIIKAKKSKICDPVFKYMAISALVDKENINNYINTNPSIFK